MEENNHNYIYGFPKVTQIVFVRQNLETLVVRIPRTFFIAHPFHRSVHYEGLTFEVFRIKENAENHSTVCTGILKFHPPKTLKQLRDLITILTYFAKRDQQIVRLVKDIFSKQLHRMAMQAQTTPLSLVDLTTETAQHPLTTHPPQLPCTSSGRRQHTRGFHPYPRTNRSEGSKSHLTKHQSSTQKSNHQILASQSSPRKSTTCSQSVSNKLFPLDQQSNNMGSCGYMIQQNFSKQSDQPMINPFQIRDSTSGMIHSPSVYSNHLQNYNNQKIVPTFQTHNVTSNNMSSDVRVLKPNEFENPSHAPYRTQMGNTTSVGVHGPTTVYHDQVTQQQIIPPSHSQTIPSNMTNSLSSLQCNQFRNPDQPTQCQPQIQIPSQRVFNQPTYLPLNNQVMKPYVNQPNGTNQAQFANSFQLQNQNPSQNVQLVPNNLHYLSTPLQINTRPQNYVPIATVNHFPSASFQDHVFIERDLSQMGPPTSNNHLASNYFSSAQTSCRSENFYPVQPHQNLYSQNNMPQWPNNTSFAQNPDFPRSQNCPMMNPINSHVHYETPSENSFQHYQEHGNWQMPSIPQIKTQVVQSTQACNNHATTISSNKLMNTVVEPTIHECARISNPSLHSMPTNNLANVNFSANNFKSNNQDSNTLSTHAKPVNRLTERISGVATNPRAQNIPQSSSASTKSTNSLQFDVLNVLNSNVKSGTKVNSQSLVIRHKPVSTNNSQANFFNNGFIKDEPNDYETSDATEDGASQHNPMSFVNLQKETSKALEVSPEDKTDVRSLQPLIIVHDDELDEDIFEIINSSSCEVINSPSSSSDSSQCLVIDENAII